MRALALWGPVAAWAFVIFVVSSLSSPPELPGPATAEVGHLAGFAVLGLLALRAAAGGRWTGVTPRTAAFAWGLSVLYGVIDEWHQSFVPGRMMTSEDLVADAAGAGLAIAAALLIARARRSRAV